jgi:hypothetical protein
MPADVTQLVHLKELLHAFGAATGLKVNYEKSNLIPINIPDDSVRQYTNALNCQLGNLPMLYLGLPLSITKPRKEYCMPLIMCIQRRLPSCAMYLHYGSKLRLVNSVLSSLPIFAMSTLKIYQWVLYECDKYRRHCLWRNKDLDSKTPPLASWDLVCRPKDQGGLGVLNLSVQNDCLLMKHLHKFYNKVNIPWVSLSWEAYYQTVLPPLRARDISFWWRDCLKSLDIYKNLASCSLQNGRSILFWTD